jgi:hypothetical protein
MIENRLFNLLIAIALVISLAFTVREAYATSAMISRMEASVRCADLPSRYSIRSQFIEEAQAWILHTEDGPVGVDGGLKELASAYRTCTK